MTKPSPTNESVDPDEKHGYDWEANLNQPAEKAGKQ